MNAWEKPRSDQEPTVLDTLGSVYSKDVNRSTSDGGSTGQYWSNPGEMFVPIVLARVEQSCQHPRAGVKTCDIRSLVEVVIQAR
jgi:hypothetical protein